MRYLGPRGGLPDPAVAGNHEGEAQGSRDGPQSPEEEERGFDKVRRFSPMKRPRGSMHHANR